MRLTKNERMGKMTSEYFNLRTDTDRFVELMYKANTWSRARRVILVIKPRPREIFDYQP